MTNPSRYEGIHRIAVILLLALAIVASLLVFPGSLLWMVACWLAIATFQIFRTGTGWLPLVVCAAILIIKRPDWSLAMVALTATLIAVAAVILRLRLSTRQPRVRNVIAWSIIGFVWLAWLATVWEAHEGTHDSNPASFDPHRPIVCLGDSLTTGLTEHEAYPAYLQESVSVPVLNMGRPGVTARDMTKYLSELLASRPQAVVIELGGHDFLRGYERTATRASLVKIIEACQDADAAVVLIEVPRGFITDAFSGLDRELARKYDLELISDTAIRMLVVRSPAIPFLGDLAVPHLSSDGLHPNEAGARYLAQTVFRNLSEMYGPSVSAE